MKICVGKEHPKLCFARPGDVVQLFDDQAEPLPEIYLVSVFTSPRYKSPSKLHPMNGLYSEKRPLFLVNLQTGEAKEMPHLSERVVIIKDAYLKLPGSDSFC